MPTKEEIERVRRMLTLLNVRVVAPSTADELVDWHRLNEMRRLAEMVLEQDAEIDALRSTLKKHLTIVEAYEGTYFLYRPEWSDDEQALLDSLGLEDIWW